MCNPLIGGSRQASIWTEGRLHDDSVNLYTQSMVSPHGFEKVAFKDFVFLHKFSTIAEVQVTAAASKNTN